MSKLINQIKKEDGVTLVELLAAIAILSIIVTAFLAYFIQAANTNHRTDEVNEATFLAQEEMEEVIHLSKTNSKDFKSRSSEVRGFIVDTVVETNSISQTNPIQMHQVIVTVKEGDNIRAQMENWLPIE